MAALGKPRVFGRIIVMIIVIFIIVIGGLVWFDFLGILDLKNVIAPVYRLVGIKARGPTAFNADSPTLLDDERFAKQLEAVDSRRNELLELERLISSAEAETAKKAQELVDREKIVLDREKSFNETLGAYENRRANIEQNARYLAGMPPANAVEILKSMEDQNIIDVLRMVEELAKKDGRDSVVAYWLSLLPAERSATLQRKMASKPSGLGD